MTTGEFKAFPKIGRLRRTCLITEKLDGTNAQILIEPFDPNHFDGPPALDVRDGFAIYAGSRSKWLAPGKRTDNFGFAAWVLEHAEELVKLGPGRHYGEWWGQGIQRTYGLTEKRFSLFNTGRWLSAQDRPACCGVVPLIASCEFTTTAVEVALWKLRQGGSLAAPGFMKPEGIVVFHTATNSLGKVLLENDDKPKGEPIELAA